MSSWDTNPWNHFCDPHSELISHNKWHPGTSEISTPPEIAVGTHFHVRHGTKTIPIFLPADREASWSQIPSSVFLLSGGRVQPESTYLCILKVTGQVWEGQKKISINTNHSHHQHSFPYASLNWSNNKVRFCLNQPNRKRWGAKLVDVKHLTHKAFLLWYHH